MKRGSIDDVRAFWNARSCNIRHSSEPIKQMEKELGWHTLCVAYKN